jgi:hypothetical protein
MHFRTTRSMHLPLAWRVERGFFIAVCAIALVVGVIGFGSHAAVRNASTVATAWPASWSYPSDQAS